MESSIVLDSIALLVLVQHAPPYFSQSCGVLSREPLSKPSPASSSGSDTLESFSSCKRQLEISRSSLRGGRSIRDNAEC